MGDSSGGWKTGKVFAPYLGNNGWKSLFPSDFMQSDHQQPAGQLKGKSKTIC